MTGCPREEGQDPELGSGAVPGPRDRPWLPAPPGFLARGAASLRRSLSAACKWMERNEPHRGHNTAPPQAALRREGRGLQSPESRLRTTDTPPRAGGSASPRPRQGPAARPSPAPEGGSPSAPRTPALRDPGRGLAPPGCEAEQSRCGRRCSRRSRGLAPPGPARRVPSSRRRTCPPVAPWPEGSHTLPCPSAGPGAAGSPAPPPSAGRRRRRPFVRGPIGGLRD